MERGLSCGLKTNNKFPCLTFCKCCFATLSGNAEHGLDELVNRRNEIKAATMKSNRTIDEFWSWFGIAAKALSADVENPALLEELDTRITKLHPKLSWEIGPGRTREWQLVISPNLDRDLRKVAKDIVARAPVVHDWQFYAGRRPKEWDYQVELEIAGDQIVSLDASKWSFVLLKYPDGSHEVLLKGTDIPPSMDKDERWQATAIVLESILGEDVILDKIDDFELVDKLDPRFAEKQRPIHQLSEALHG